MKATPPLTEFGEIKRILVILRDVCLLQLGLSQNYIQTRILSGWSSVESLSLIKYMMNLV